MSFSIAAFRANFPEFADDTKYTDAIITFWEGIADKRLNILKWGDLIDEGLQLYTAHHIVLATMNIADVAAGADPGKSSGVISSQSVGGVSVSVDTGASLETNAGYWNETSYGRQFYRLIQTVAAGGAFIA